MYDGVLAVGTIALRTTLRPHARRKCTSMCSPRASVVLWRPSAGTGARMNGTVCSTSVSESSCACNASCASVLQVSGRTSGGCTVHRLLPSPCALACTACDALALPLRRTTVSANVVVQTALPSLSSCTARSCVLPVAQHLQYQAGSSGQSCRCPGRSTVHSLKQRLQAAERSPGV